MKGSERKVKNIFVEGAIAPEFIAESIRKHSTKLDIGAHEIFLGQVRADKKNSSSDGEGSVGSIVYSAYEDMALARMHDIREEVFDRYPITCMHVYHSLGEVKAGELCFFVFASSEHRKVAREAVAELVDRIKEELPIFGKEVLESGEHTWKVNS